MQFPPLGEKDSDGRFPLQVSVRTVITEAEDIKSFELVAAAGLDLPPAPAGAHIDVLLSSGQSRQYSIYNGGSDESSYRIAVLRDDTGRGGSVAMHTLREGDELAVSPPRDRFPLASDTRPSVLIAGGIGITPILSMADELSRRGSMFELHYANRSRRRAAFAKELRGRKYADSLHFYFDDEDAVIDLKGIVKGAIADGSRIYVCGPIGLIDAVYATSDLLGMSRELVHSERFGAPQKSPLGNPTDENPGGLEEFEIVVNSTGQSLIVQPSQTIAEVLIAAGVDIPLSCEAGICGTCETRVLDGIPQHNDEYLTADEKASNKVLTPCCSRSQSKRLVLDL